MGVLDHNEVPQVIPVSEKVARQIKNETRNTFKDMVKAFNGGAKLFWQNDRGVTPADIAVALGSDAKEIFELHAKLGALIASIKPEAISAGASLVGSFTVNEDGTVSVVVVDPVPAPTPPEETIN
jgi:hypothetical protein